MARLWSDLDAASHLHTALPLILNIGAPGDFRAIYYFAIWSLLLTVVQTYAMQRRREKALRTIIEQEAPELHQKLAEKLRAEI